MGEEHSPPGNVDCGKELLKITFSCFARYRQGMLLEVIFLAVGNSSQILPSALAGCLHCKYHAAENPHGCSMKAPAPIWRMPGPMVRLGGGLMDDDDDWRCFAGAGLRRVVCKAEAPTGIGLPSSCNPISWLACNAPKTVLTQCRLSVHVCLRWVISKV